MGWVLNLVVQGLVGLILSSVSSIMGIFSFSLGEFFATNAFFNNMFMGGASIDENPLISLFIGVGLALCLGLVLVGIMKSVMAGFGWTNESPLKMIGRLAIGMFLCIYLYKFLTDFIYGGEDSIFYLMFGWSANTIEELTNTTVGNINALDAITSVGAASIGGIAYNLLLIFLSVAILTNFIKLLLELFERYILLNVAIICSPLAPAGLVLESTTKVFSGYLKFVFGQMMILWLDNVFFAMSIGALRYASTLMTEYQALRTIIAMLALLAFLKIFQRLDNYMRDIGMVIGITGSSLLSELYAAAKTVGAVKKTVSKGGSKAGAAAAGGVAAGTAAGVITAMAGGAKGGSGASYSQAAGAGGGAPKERSIGMDAFISGGGGVFAKGVSKSIRGFGKAYEQARYNGADIQTSMKEGIKGFREAFGDTGRRTADAFISPGLRTDFKNFGQATAKYSKNIYDKIRGRRPNPSPDGVPNDSAGTSAGADVKMPSGTPSVVSTHGTNERASDASAASNGASSNTTSQPNGGVFEVDRNVKPPAGANKDIDAKAIDNAMRDYFDSMANGFNDN